MELVSEITLYQVHNILASELANCLNAVIVLIFHMDNKLILLVLHTERYPCKRRELYPPLKFILFDIVNVFSGYYQDTRVGEKLIVRPLFDVISVQQDFFRLKQRFLLRIIKESYVIHRRVFQRGKGLCRADA